MKKKLKGDFPQCLEGAPILLPTSGQSAEVKEYFYAISMERRVTNPIVSTVVEAARESLFA